MSFNRLVFEALRSALGASTLPFEVTLRPDVAHADDRPPYCVYQRVALAPFATLTLNSSLAQAIYQIDIYASTRAAVDEIAAVLRFGLQGVEHASMTLTDSHCSYEAEASLYREMLTYSVWAPTPI